MRCDSMRHVHPTLFELSYSSTCTIYFFSQAGLRHSGSHFTLEMPFGVPFPSVWVEDLTVKVSDDWMPQKDGLLPVGWQ